MIFLLACTPDPPPQPDVVLVVVDTLRADAVGFAGAPHPSTPNLDALVETEAAWFADAYASSSWTLPSTASLITGKPVWKHGAIRSDDQCFGRLDPELPTVATLWSLKGYRTGAWLNNAFLAPQFRLDRDFDVYSWEGAELVGHRTAQETVDQALAFLDADEGPAFLLVHIMEPHADYAPGPEFAGRFSKDLPHTLSSPVGEATLHGFMREGVVPGDEDQAWLRAVYQEEVLQADAAIGELISGLKQRDRWDEALFVVTSDHGEEFWDLGEFEHGHTLRSSVTHVPLVVKAPDVMAGRVDGFVPGHEVGQLVGTNQGPLLNAAKGFGISREHIVSEDILYGAPAVSIATRTHRLVQSLAGPSVVLHPIEGGVEGAPLADSPQVRTTVDGLRQALAQERGSLGPTAASDPTRIGSAAVFEQLKQLGYVDDASTGCSQGAEPGVQEDQGP